VLLAAGTSSRFGDRNKLLQQLGGRAVVARAATTLVDSVVDERVAVVGHEAERVRAALDGLPIKVVRNRRYAEGQSTSVRAGIRAAEGLGAAAVVIALGDMPLVEPETVTGLVERFRRTTPPAVVPVHEGRRGMPVVFAAERFPALRSVTGDVGGRALLESGDPARVPVPDPGIHVDVDTPDALALLR
jgi:molybdenum cofactor cytidylyltransferase